MSIIMIRGTHGSGKSTCVRRVLESYTNKRAIRAPGRKRPLAYLCESNGMKQVLILGSYETPTGGCDTIPDVDVVYSMIRETDCPNVLFEGILAQHSTTKLLELNKIKPVTAIVLTTTLDEAILSVQKRRLERGDDRPMSTHSIEKEFKSVISSARRMKVEGMKVMEMGREEAFQTVMGLLSVGHLMSDIGCSCGNCWICAGGSL